MEGGRGERERVRAREVGRWNGRGWYEERDGETEGETGYPMIMVILVTPVFKGVLYITHVCDRGHCPYLN